MKRLLAVLVLTLSITGFIGDAAAQQKLVIKFAHHAPVTYPYQDGALRFKEVAERISGGKLEVQVFGGAQLGGERDLLEGIKLGTLHMCIGAGGLANFAPAYNVVQLPFLIKNQEHMVKIAEGPAGRLLSQRIEEQGGYKVLGYFSTGDSGIQTVKGPVRTPADLKGVKIRVMENPALIESMRAMGANPTPLPFPELYTSMKQGVVEGATIDYTALWTTKVYEAVKYVTEPGFHFLAEPRPVLISAKFFASQPAEVQQWIAQAAQEASVYERSLFKDRQGKAIEDLRAKGIQFAPMDEAAFLTVMKPVWQKVAAGYKAEDLLDAIVKAGQ
ncbi:MAG TPA: TRAP transporter substrate-binding protein [Candidatus Eisenbacteria bacterium]|nr:TRAP transporter substrate-binding protein [Candidatus Eisenbacteria bacterium]